MKKILIDIHGYLYNRNRIHHYKGKNLFMWAFCNAGFRFASYILYFVLKTECLCGKSTSNKLAKESKIVVSLTTFPARIKMVWMTVESLLRQTVRPKEIRLYLSLEEFPNKDKGLPKSLLRYVGRGLNIKFVEKNMKPHTKYIYAFQEVLTSDEDDLVVTVDDDLYYREDMIERLLQLHEEFPNCVCSNLIHEIKKDCPYTEWSGNGNSRQPSHGYLALGVGGVLYPVRLFKDARMFDKNLIEKHCLRADDLWLKAFELLNGIPVVTGDLYMPYVDIPYTQGISLKSTNTNIKAAVNNDTQWKNLNDLFNVETLLPPPH